MILKTGTKALGLVEQYPISLYQGFKNRRLFADVNTFCMFIGYPRSSHSLKELCHFLGMDASDDYLKDCASIVFKSPHKSRYDTQWGRELIDIVKNRMKKFHFLEGYSYED